MKFLTKNFFIILITLSSIGVIVSEGCVPTETPQEEVSKYYTPQVSNHLKAMLPDGATDIVPAGENWVYFTLDKRKFLLGFVAPSADRFGVCITQIEHYFNKTN